MKRKFNMIKVYTEAILYSICLILTIFLCLSENVYITMFPIAFTIGIIGQIIFGKKVMTSFFCGILTIFLLQIKTPALIVQNILITLQIVILTLTGEMFGWAVKRAFRLSKKKKNISKKIKNEKIKCSIICTFSLVLGIMLSTIFNGNYITYFKAKNSLKEYFIQEYHSSSRFKIVSSKYMFSINPKYIFYTQDTISNNVVGKFSVYLKDDYNVQDDYQEQVINRKSSKMNDEISKIYKSDDIQMFVTNSEVNELTICFIKQVNKVNKEQIELYSREIEECLNNIKNIDNFNDINQIKVILESSTNPKENLASYIFMSGYMDMLEKGEEEAHSYIMRALNIEYFD